MSSQRTIRREQERREVRPSGSRIALPRGSRGSFNFIRDTYAELKKVVWPTREQTVHLSTIVIIGAAAVGVVLGAIDWVFTQVVRQFLVPGL